MLAVSSLTAENIAKSMRGFLTKITNPEMNAKPFCTPHVFNVVLNPVKLLHSIHFPRQRAWPRTLFHQIHNLLDLLKLLSLVEQVEEEIIESFGHVKKLVIQPWNCVLKCEILTKVNSSPSTAKWFTLNMILQYISNRSSHRQLEFPMRP